MVEIKKQLCWIMLLTEHNSELNQFNDEPTNWPNKDFIDRTILLIILFIKFKNFKYRFINTLKIYLVGLTTKLSKRTEPGRNWDGISRERNQSQWNISNQVKYGKWSAERI
jgi:hypothetical protein